MAHPFATPGGNTLAEHAVKEPRKSMVIMHNDNYTTMDFVVQVLIEVFNKNIQDARKIMMTIHEKGRGVCGVYPMEIAETKIAVVHGRAREAGFPLRCSLEVL